VHVDPRLEQFTALIEQQRSRQPAMKLAGNSRSLKRESGITSRLTTTQPIRPVYEDAADRARAAMSARNPALAAKLELARLNSSVIRTAALGSVESSSATSRSERPQRLGSAPVSRDLLAIPKRPAPTPGLGQSIDTYA
jgi:hypothetical protein